MPFPRALLSSAPGATVTIEGASPVRASVHPLVFALLNGTFRYHGTAWCAAADGNFCSAAHVIIDGAGPSKKANEFRASGCFGLMIAPSGLGYGRLRANFRQFRRAWFVPQDPDPLSFSDEQDPSRFGIDLTRITFELQRGDPVAPLRARTGTKPTIKSGDHLIAVGFNDVYALKTENDAIISLSQNCCGVRLRVAELQQRPRRGMGGGTIIIFEQNIPGGLSGGPIFDHDGVVVGLVSTGDAYADYGTGLCLEDLPSGVLPE
jgi:hypothetical protein